MSKYNIDDMVYHVLFEYIYVTSTLKEPCFIYAIANKFGKNKQIIDELNATCRIIFYNDTIMFTPHYRRKILRDKSYSKIKYVRGHIQGLLTHLGFDTHVFKDKNYCGTVYVSLRNPKNNKRMRQLGNVFKFDCSTHQLTQSVLDFMQQNKR